MDNKINEFNDALCDIRKAHRLIYSYQNKMLDLADFIRRRLDLNEFKGQKWFSDAISQKRNSYLNIWKDMWAWDFIYTYVFEYHLGEETLDNNDQFSISLIQYSDTGYFENDNDNRTNISAYECEEESGSKLLFYFELKPKKKDWIWNLEDIIMNKEYASIKHERTTLISSKGNIQILYSFALDNFLTEESTMKALKLFTDYCTDKCNIEFNLV